MKIHVLPPIIANKIAAGEVVERPSSVVKELAENSVDAGATHITIEIKKGGMSYIRITDNGCGIEKGEVATAFLRHATSKIQNESDLDAIYTLGFRGEALASIAAVARVDIFTKTANAPLGTCVSVEGGSITDEEESGCPDGTTITVRDLFFNTPARMKFLKNDSTETGYVTDVIHKLILSHPEIGVKFINNGKTVLQSAGDGKLQSCVRTVYGKDYPPNLIPVDYKAENVTITGFIGNASLARRDRRQQVFFINGRSISSRVLSAALSEAYQNTMMVGRFPVAVLNLSVSAAFVDVNVHPTKMEVRFSDDKKVYQSVYWAVKNSLSVKKYVPEIELKPTASPKAELQKILAEQYKGAEQINFLKDAYIHDGPAKLKETEQTKKSQSEQTQEAAAQTPKAKQIQAEQSIQQHIHETSFFSAEDISAFQEQPKNESAQDLQQTQNDLSEHFAKRTVVTPTAENVTVADNEKFPQKTAPLSKQKIGETAPIIEATEADGAKTTEQLYTISKETLASIESKQNNADTDFKIIGQVFNTYIIVQKDNTMLLIDQHAAHERIYFEQLVQEYTQKGILSQLLLLPVTINLTPEEFVLAEENLALLGSLGYECEAFGETSIIVRAVPGTMGETEIKDTVVEIISLLQQNKINLRKNLLEDALHTMACKRAVKGNHVLTLEEMKVLVTKILSFTDINTCPHGRPIMTKMTKYELEKQFKRIV